MLRRTAHGYKIFCRLPLVHNVFQIHHVNSSFMQIWYTILYKSKRKPCELFWRHGVYELVWMREHEIPVNYPRQPQPPPHWQNTEIFINNSNITPVIAHPGAWNDASWTENVRCLCHIAVIVVKFEEINLKFEKVQDKIKFEKVRVAHSITTIIRRHSVTWAYAYVI